MTTVRPVLDRALDKIKTDPETGCWIWQGYVKPDGYGCIKVDRASRAAHRVVYELLVGPIPGDLTIDHLCRNRTCVNPDHLEPVTQGENNRRRLPATHCAAGHEWTPENIAHGSDGLRRCRACRRARARAAYWADVEKSRAYHREWWRSRSTRPESTNREEEPA